MALIKTPKYLRSVKKIVSSHKLTQKIIDDTEMLLLENRYDISLHFKSITCKRDKNRYSVRVPNSAYRILITLLENDDMGLVTLLNHKDYDRHNKDC